MKKNGFTLVELMVVITLVMLLFAFTSADYLKFRDRLVLEGTAKEVASALELANKYARTGNRGDGANCGLSGNGAGTVTQEQILSQTKPLLYWAIRSTDGKTLETTSIYKSNTYSISKHIWNCSTQIPPIDNILKNVSSNAYSHHIERLMGIGNFLVLIETNPKEIYKWFQTMYIDAYDVFMIPNVYGMLCYGKLNENSHMMTRPYFASSNYLIKMSDYKSDLCVKIDNQLYKWDKIMDALYWYHIFKYSEEFKKIYATSSGVARWKKFDSNKKKNIIELAKKYIKWIHNK